ncbi:MULTISPECIES: hypothetical protein [Luteibacter]|uniref:hypothetical protein n=1 Tax=Luteibacter TaxID=242605 RepID=UPI0012E0848B|nr:MULTISPECIES: hypothetical protein [unclassified Luteibacter]
MTLPVIRYTDICRIFGMQMIALGTASIDTCRIGFARLPLSVFPKDERAARAGFDAGAAISALRVQPGDRGHGA